MGARARLEAELAQLLDNQLKAQIFTHSYFETGFLGQSEPVSKLTHLPHSKTVFDLASLTKALVTTSLFFELRTKGEVVLDGPLRDWAPRSVRLKDELLNLSAREILAHSSGLPSWRNFWTNRLSSGAILPQLFMDAPAYIEAVLQRPGITVGAKVDCYSDVGFILLGYVLEKLRRQNLHQMFRAFCIEHSFFEHHAEIPLFFLPNEEQRARCISTGYCAVRERELIGEVFDENCAAFGGVAGHAGLFGSGDAVSRFLKKFFETDAGRAAREENMRAMVPKNDSSLCGYRFGNDPVTAAFCGGDTFGHYGFTGTAIWIEPRSGKYVVFLTNRVIHSRVNPGFRGIRQEVFRLADKILGS